MPERLTRAILAAPSGAGDRARCSSSAPGSAAPAPPRICSRAGFGDPASESAVADEILDQRFDRGGLQAVIKLDVDLGTDISTDSTAMEVGKGIVDELQTISYVQDPGPLDLGSAGTGRRVAEHRQVVDADHRQPVRRRGPRPEHADALAERFGGRQGVRIRVGGQGDGVLRGQHPVVVILAIAEGIAIPITFLVLIFVFGGVIAASLPVGIGIVAIVLTFAYLRLIADLHRRLDLRAQPGHRAGTGAGHRLHPAVVDRYREEVRDGRTREDAIGGDDGHRGPHGAVLGDHRRARAGGARADVLPAVLRLRRDRRRGGRAGRRADRHPGIAGAARAARRQSRRPRADAQTPLRRPGSVGTNDVEDSFWYRIARFAMRRAVLVLVAVVALLVLLGAPFLGFKFGFPDDRVLPASAVSHTRCNRRSATVTSRTCRVCRRWWSPVPATPTASPCAATARTWPGSRASTRSPHRRACSSKARRWPGDPAATSEGVAIVTVSSSLEPAATRRVTWCAPCGSSNCQTG